MGGAAAAFALCKAQLRVLLIEKGRQKIEATEEPAALLEDPEARMRAGHWPSQMVIQLDDVRRTIWPSMGSGVGGSTLLYAATLGRLEPEDFETREMPDGRTVAWPFSYSELEPYYISAERILGTCGTRDPRRPDAKYELLDPPAMGESDRYIFEQLCLSGLHPFRVHNAIDYVAGCTECGGRICDKKCKGDAARCFVTPAFETGNLTILPETEVIQVRADRAQASEVVARNAGRERVFSADNIFLAAGSLATPALLQRSKGVEWPKGIGNDLDLVGRNLMFHASDFVAIWPKKHVERSGPQRTIAMRDFYRVGNRTLGEVQSMGLSAGYGEILTYLHQLYDLSFLRHLKPLKPLLRIPAKVGALLFREATVFTTIVEDFPYLRNRVTTDEDNGTARFSVNYTIPEELGGRVRELRKLLKDRIKGLLVLTMNPEVALNYGHGCGTCRSGSDPADSVVDPDCRIHGVSNLYVVDGSIMPTSGGTNPSLTIAANALRVVDRMVNRSPADS